MATSVHLGLAMVSMVLLMAPTILVHSHSSHHPTEIILYIQVIRSGPNANLITVAGPNPPRNNNFGSTFLVDYILRESIDIDSPPVGRVQGIGVIKLVDGTQSYYSVTYYFDHGKYSGSTLQLQGIAEFPVRRPFIMAEFSATSGTKSFSHMSGYVQLQTVQVIPSINSTIDQAKIFLKGDN